jgi:hypothetical protein
MNNVKNRKRGGPNHCFECGALDHLRSHCPKLGRGKKEDDGRVKPARREQEEEHEGEGEEEALHVVANLRNHSSFS